MSQCISIFSYIYMNIHSQEVYHADKSNSPAPLTKCFKTTRHYHSVCKIATIQGYCKPHMSGSKCVTKLHTHLNGEGSPLPLRITTIVRKASIFCSLIWATNWGKFPETVRHGNWGSVVNTTLRSTCSEMLKRSRTCRVDVPRWYAYLKLSRTRPTKIWRSPNSNIYLQYNVQFTEYHFYNKFQWYRKTAKITIVVWI